MALLVALAAFPAVPAASAEGPETLADSVGAERLAAWMKDESRLKAAYAECASKLEKPALGITVPVETWPDGSTKIAAAAGKAKFFEKEALVWCGDVTVKEFTEKGELKATFFAKGCVVDRETKSGWLEGHARGEMGGTSIEGDGIYFSFPEEVVRVAANVEIVSDEFKFEGVKL